MRIIRFCATWCPKCRIFSNKSKLGYDTDIDIDLPSYYRTLIKYQISIIPTFLALSDNNRILGKLTNPTTIEEYEKWKKKLKK